MSLRRNGPDTVADISFNVGSGLKLPSAYPSELLIYDTVI